MTDFTPLASSVGGLLIGAAATLLFLGIGRVAGVSGILGSILSRREAPMAWRVAFLAGLPLGAFIVSRAMGGASIDIHAEPLTLVIAGLLVGFGTRLGSGCTSGHGVCGMARGSRRSIVATGVFIAVGVSTVTLVRSLAGAGG